MTPPRIEVEAPVASDEFKVTGPIWEIVAPDGKVSPSPLELTTLTRVASVASVASTEKMYGFPFAMN